MREGSLQPRSRVGRVLALVFLLVMLVPLGYAIWMSFAPGELLEPPTRRWSLRWYRELLSSAKWTQALATTAAVAFLSVTISLTAGLSLAVAVARYHFRGQHLVAGAILLPLFIPATVLAMGMLPLVLILGLWESPLALAAGHSLISVPVVFLLLRGALSGVDPNLEWAARGLGASPWITFRRVTLPLILPSILGGAVVALILSVNEFTLSLFLSSPRYRTLPAALWPEARYKDTPVLAAASAITVLTTLAGLVLAAWLLRAWRMGSRRHPPRPL
jgi:ABC-type spermidine/putrescine transport system permease subunit II